MSQPQSISVIIPVFNREDHLHETIISAVTQNPPIDEIIIIDNCSTDQSYQIADNFSRHHPNISLHRNNVNIGMIANWNEGIKKSKGQYISILHSDDIMPPDWTKDVNACLNKLRAGLIDVGLIFGPYITFKENHNQKKVLSIIRNFKGNQFFAAGESVKKLWEKFYGNPNCSCAVIYKKNIFGDQDWFNPKFHAEADQEFHIRMMQKYPVQYLDSVLLFYRIHSFQGFNEVKSIESDATTVNRLLNSNQIQLLTLNSKHLIFYSNCGLLAYAGKFLIAGKFEHVKKLLLAPYVLYWRTILNLPKFLLLYLNKKLILTSYFRKKLS